MKSVSRSIEGVAVTFDDPSLVADDLWDMPWRTPNVFLTARSDEVKDRLGSTPS